MLYFGSCSIFDVKNKLEVSFVNLLKKILELED